MLHWEEDVKVLLFLLEFKILRAFYVYWLIMNLQFSHLSLNMSKPFIGISEMVRYKPTCAIKRAVNFGLTIKRVCTTHEAKTKMLISNAVTVSLF